MGKTNLRNNLKLHLDTSILKYCERVKDRCKIENWICLFRTQITGNVRDINLEIMSITMTFKSMIIIDIWGIVEEGTGLIPEAWQYLDFRQKLLRNRCWVAGAQVGTCY